jgi:S-adenosylmethionine synthetase
MSTRNESLRLFLGGEGRLPATGETMRVESFIHRGLAIAQMPFEIVEIKGRGHPDTICDSICEQVSDDLLKLYETQCGRPLHYNVDKALLIGGKSSTRFGGGAIVESVKLYLGDRATDSFNGKPLRLKEVVRESIESWLSENLRFLKLDLNLELHDAIKPGSESLSAVEERKVSNDTSVGVGSWPPTPLERAVIGLEANLNSREFKSRHPETGEDIKLMATRHGREVNIICAIAMVDRYLDSVDDYLEKKRAVTKEIELYLRQLQNGMDFSVAINCLDAPEREESGLYLTVTGLSCENGDSGQVGRGNRANGVISFLRPQTMEAWAGKNPISHVGKIYSFAALNLAKIVCESFPEASQADIFMVGQIGSPATRPSDVLCNMVVPKNCAEPSLREEANRILAREINRGHIFRVRGPATVRR